MKSFSEIVHRSWIYLIFCLGFAFLISLYCVLLGKSEGFLLINQYHTRPLDIFFILFTNLGNGLFAIGLIAIMLIRKKIGWAIQIAISFLVSGLVAQLFK